MTSPEGAEPDYLEGVIVDPNPGDPLEAIKDNTYSIAMATAVGAQATRSTLGEVQNLNGYVGDVHSAVLDTNTAVREGTTETGQKLDTLGVMLGGALGEVRDATLQAGQNVADLSPEITSIGTSVDDLSTAVHGLVRTLNPPPGPADTRTPLERLLANQLAIDAEEVRMRSVAVAKPATPAPVIPTVRQRGLIRRILSSRIAALEPGIINFKGRTGPRRFGIGRRSRQYPFN